MSNYPSVITTFTNPLSNQPLNAPSHSGIETAQNAGLTQLQTFVGVEGSASTVGTLIYDVRSPGSNGGGHIQTANKGGTGQVNYVKGDLLVGQSTSVISKLSVGPTDGLALIVDSTQATGIRWGVPGNKPTIRVFSIAAGVSSIMTWVKPSNLSYLVVQVQAPGGAGASVLSNSNYAAGGSAGGYALKVLAASVLGATEEIRVGSGGKVSSTLTGISSFGLSNPAASILANPGLQGVLSSGNPIGGIATGGDINVQGGSGTPGGNAALVGIAGNGGNSPLGFGGPGMFGSGGTQIAPTGWGAGSGGGANDNSGITHTPFTGGDGVVIVAEY